MVNHGFHICSCWSTGRERAPDILYLLLLLLLLPPPSSSSCCSSSPFCQLECQPASENSFQPDMENTKTMEKTREVKVKSWHSVVIHCCGLVLAYFDITQIMFTHLMSFHAQFHYWYYQWFIVWLCLLNLRYCQPFSFESLWLRPKPLILFSAEIIL